MKASCCRVFATFCSALLCIALFSGCPKPIQVPSVVGQTQAAAQSAITSADLAVGTVTQQFSSTVAVGLVISQNPAAGSRVNAGARVSLVVSRGPETATVPNVVGQTQAAAQTAIAGAGLTVGTLTQQSSSTVAAGLVISQDPPADTAVAGGSSVALVVSTGATLVAVPFVIGEFNTNARTAIEDVGLTVGAVTEEMSCTVFNGNVINQVPAPGTMVPLGSSVSLVISIESALTRNWVGMTQIVATTDMVFGFTVGAITEDYDDTILNGHVLRTVPPANECVAVGTVVDIVMSLGPAPIEINDIAELQKIGNDPVYRLDGNYDLAGDIDASSTGLKGGAGFTPIGSGDHPFTGRLFGHGFTISGLVINRPEQDNVGIFASAGVFDDPNKSAVIMDLNLDGGSIIGHDSVGAVCGSLTNGAISNCESGTPVTGEQSIGGLVGAVGSQAGLDRCIATGAVTSITLGDIANQADAIGGLAGINFGSITRCSARGPVNGGPHGTATGGLIGENGGPVSESSASGNVISSTSWIGGLIGLNIIAHSDVTDCEGSGDVTGFSEVGGLIGYNSECRILRCRATGNVRAVGAGGGLIGNNSDGEVTECVAEGDVVVSNPELESAFIAGGLIGINIAFADPLPAIRRCYALGSVTGSEYIGGLIGRTSRFNNNDVSGPVIECYAAGAVSAVTDSGGLIGFVNVGAPSFVSNSFWDVNTTGVNASAGGGTGLPTAQMMQQTSFTAAGWDFEETWAIDEGESYPTLQWLLESGD